MKWGETAAPDPTNHFARILLRCDFWERCEFWHPIAHARRCLQALQRTGVPGALAASEEGLMRLTEFTETEPEDDMRTASLASFHSHQQFFQANKQHWFESGPDNKHSLERSSFGDWSVRRQRLAKTTRQLLSDGTEKRQFCLDLYKTHQVDSIEAVASKDLFAILEKANRRRNDWKGHSGIAGAQEHRRRLTVLHLELTAFREAIGSAFQGWSVLKPGANEFTAGVYHFKATKLSGSRTIFKEVEVESSVVMDKHELLVRRHAAAPVARDAILPHAPEPEDRGKRLLLL